MNVAAEEEPVEDAPPVEEEPAAAEEPEAEAVRACSRGPEMTCTALPTRGHFRAAMSASDKYSGIRE